jgi:pilus assembly protein CpaB
MKLLVAAAGFGMLAALLAVFYLKAREAALRAKLAPSDKMIQVVVANRDLVKGTVVEADPAIFAIRPIPQEYVHSDAITAAQLPQVQGKKLVENLAKGKALLYSFLDDHFPRDFSDTIPLQRRAMTVQVDEVNSVNGFIRPGNRIDILVSLPAGAAGSESSSGSVIPLLENVEVLATGRDSAYEYEEKMRLIQGGVMHAPANNYTSITINVTPEQAALVETAQEKGDLLALLRNRIDTSGFGFTHSPGTLRDPTDHAARG